MRLLGKITLLAGLGMTVVAFSACKESAKGGGNGAAAATGTGTSTKKSTKTVSDDATPEDAADEGEDSGANCGSASLRLTSTVSYNVEIKAIMDARCVSCHSGISEPDLTTYKNVKDNLEGVLRTIKATDATKMPPNNASTLTDDQKTALSAWADAGALESADGTTATPAETDECTSGDTPEDTEDGTSVATTGTSTGTTTADEAVLWEQLITPAKFTECKAAGKLYDRAKEDCHKATLDTTYTCTTKGIVGAFSKLGLNPEAQLKTWTDDGYKIDQCGEFNDEPIVFLLREKKAGESLKIEVKKICKTGSAACG